MSEASIDIKQLVAVPGRHGQGPSTVFVSSPSDIHSPPSGIYMFVIYYYILKRCTTRASEPIHVIVFLFNHPISDPRH
jgi:hypothetical protein